MDEPRLPPFVQQVGTTFVAQAATLVASIVTGALIARGLGPEAKGVLTLAWLLVGLLGLVLGGGLGVANAYLVGSGRFSVSTLTSLSVAYVAVASALGWAAAALLLVTDVLGVALRGVPAWAVLTGVLALPATMLTAAFTGLLQGLRRITAASTIVLLQAGVTLGLVVLLVVRLELFLAGALAATVGSAWVAAVAAALLVRRQGGRLTPSWDSSTLRAVLSFGGRGQLGNILQFFNYRLDQFILNLFAGASGVGIYGVAVTLAELLWYLPHAVGFVIFPLAASTRPQIMNTFTPRVFLVTLGLTAAVAAGLALGGPHLIRVIYSSAFLPAYRPMLVLLPGAVLLAGAKVLSNEIAGRGFPHYNAIHAGAALILTVVLDLLLIPRFGLLGAAAASSIVYTMIFAMTIGFYIAVSHRRSAPVAPAVLG